MIIEKLHEKAKACVENFRKAKAKEVPELKQAIDTGKLTTSQARRITAVVTSDNQASWIEKAANLRCFFIDGFKRFSRY